MALNFSVWITSQYDVDIGKVDHNISVSHSIGMYPQEPSQMFSPSPETVTRLKTLVAD